MNIDKLLNDAVKVHNIFYPDLIIWKNQVGPHSFYFIYCSGDNIFYEDACELYLYLIDKLRGMNICPYICMKKVNCELKIGICIDVYSQL